MDPVTLTLARRYADERKRDIRTSGFPFPSDLIAFWDFTEEGPPYYAKAGVDSFPLVVGGGNPQRVSGDPFGGGLRFNGTSDFLIIPKERVGALRVARSSDEVTVVAWIKHLGYPTASHFVAGIWQENNNDPRRQYALFDSLPKYGGQNRVCGHISKTGGPSPGLPYSRDYSASGDVIPPNVIQFTGFTYDGNVIKSYRDGICDSYTSYTEPEPPKGQGLTYDKNPYAFDLGLNAKEPPGDFTVGAVLLTGGWSNFFQGELYGLAVFRRALSHEEMLKLHLDSKLPGEPVYFFGMDSPNGSLNPKFTPVYHFGWRRAAGPSAQDPTQIEGSWRFGLLAPGAQPFVFNATDDAYNPQTTEYQVLEKTGLKGPRIGQISRITFDMNNKGGISYVKFCICVDGVWYATADDYSHPGGSTSGSNWSTKVTHELTVSRAKDNWLELNYVHGQVLSLGGTPASDLPNGNITGIALLSLPMPDDSIIRVTNIRVYR